MMYTHIFEDENALRQSIVISVPDFEVGCHDDYEIDKDVFFKMMFAFKNGHTEFDREYEEIGHECIKYTKLHATVDENIVRFKQTESFNTVSYSFEYEFHAHLDDLMNFANRYALTH